MAGVVDRPSTEPYPIGKEPVLAGFATQVPSMFTSVMPALMRSCDKVIDPFPV